MSARPAYLLVLSAWALTAACSGSSSETPWPLEPDPRAEPSAKPADEAEARPHTDRLERSPYSRDSAGPVPPAPRTWGTPPVAPAIDGGIRLR